MDAYQLKSLIAIARHGNLSRAANALYLSQPAVSAHIKTLEEELGIALFERHAKGMSLTEYGTVIYHHAQKILASFEAMKNEAAAMIGDLSGELVIGTVNDAASLRLPAILQFMREQAPNLRVSLVQAMSGIVVRNVCSGEFDAGFVEGDHSSPDLISTMLARAEFVVAYPTPWEGRIDPANRTSLFSLPWIGTPDDCSFHRLTGALFANHGFEFSPSIRTDQESLLVDLVSQEAGLSLLRREHAEERLHAGRLCIAPDLAVNAAIHFVSARHCAKPGLVALARRAVCAAWGQIQL